MTSILPAPLKIQNLVITDDSSKLMWDFTLRCQTKKSLSLTTELTLILRSPLDSERITFESKDIKTFTDSIELKPGTESFAREVSLDQLKSDFQSTINEIMKDRKTSLPIWKLKLSFTDGDHQQTFGTTFKSAPENWFGNFEN